MVVVVDGGGGVVVLIVVDEDGVGDIAVVLGVGEVVLLGLLGNITENNNVGDIIIDTLNARFEMRTGLEVLI